MQILEYPEACAQSIYTRSMKLYDLWNRLRGDRPMPLYEELDPLEIGADSLPFVVLLEVVDDGEDFIWRVCGGEHTARYGKDMKNWRVSELTAENAEVDKLRRLLRSIVERPEPRFFEFAYTNAYGNQQYACTVMCPLADKQGQVARLVGCTDWK